MIEQVKCSTPDFAEENVAKLIKLFPEVEGETGMVDLDKLRQVLSSKVIEGNVERYEFTWPGKRAAKAAASAATTKTLRPCREESVNFDTTENLYIEGDNLEVLKLLQTSYAGKVKMIYIDPPYNTGHDFVYRDKFSLTQKELENEAGSFDEDGNRFEVNDSAEARYHSNWCSMMYPRLKLARNLLRDDGVLFVSIGEDEITNLIKICEELFGESNKVATFVWKNKYGPGAFTKGVASLHEYIVCFAKNFPENVEAPLSEDDIAKYKLRDEKYGVRGGYVTQPLATKSKDDRPNLVYPLVHNGKEIWPNKQWIWERSRLQLAYDKGEVIVNEDHGVTSVRFKQYLRDENGVMRNGKPLSLINVAFNQDGTKEIEEFLGRGVFDFPKPTALIRHFISFILNDQEDKDFVVLDFFSGSATTADAVMRKNAEDGGKRKYILVQLPEKAPIGSKAEKEGYSTICEIGKERIRRAGKKISEELRAKSKGLKKKAGKTFTQRDAEMFASLASANQTIEQSEQSNNRTIPDIGFRVLKLDSSSLNDTSATVSETDQKFANFDRIKEGRSSEDLLFQMLLETHIPLSDKIEKKTVGGNEVFFVSGTALVACLDAKAKMTTDFFIAVAKLKPGIAFFRDDAFADDSARTNLQQAFDQFSPSTAIKVI